MGVDLGGIWRYNFKKKIEGGMLCVTIPQYTFRRFFFLKAIMQTKLFRLEVHVIILGLEGSFGIFPLSCL